MEPETGLGPMRSQVVAPEDLPTVLSEDGAFTVKVLLGSHDTTKGVREGGVGGEEGVGGDEGGRW